jgi:hypothetical protein
MAQIIGIRGAKTTADHGVRPDLRLRLAAAEGGRRGRTAKVTLYGQEKDAATSGLARMNMILHNNPTALIMQGNTLDRPQVQGRRRAQDLRLRGRQPAVLDKRWSTGLDPLNDPYGRFQAFGTPPAKQGDYAYLLHIVRSLKSTGKGACILPHGVLFRGNAEADIRRTWSARATSRASSACRQPVLRHRHSRLHRRHRQGRRAGPQGHLHDRRQQRLHEGRPQEPPARAGHPQDRGCVQQAASTCPNTPAWWLRGDREERIQPQPAALHRQPDAEDLQDIAGHLQGGIPEPM